MKKAKRIMRKLNKGGKMIIHTRIKYSILLIIPLILLILLPSVSLANANKIFKENNKAVVVVTAYDDKGNAIGQGSGFIVRRDGAVVTNYHVISKARDIKVKVEDKVFDVEGLIFIDKENDLVILKAKAKDMPVVKLGVVEKANIGEQVYVISSPAGFENTISDGLLSGIRKIDEEREILQITAPISPGSSGGAVFNRNGEVIGVVTMLIEEAQNLNFAMPVKLIKDKVGSKRVTTIKESDLEDYEETVAYWINLGCAYCESGMYKEATEAFQQAIIINPDHGDAYFNLGVVYRKLGMSREAIEACKQAIIIEPDFADAHYALGNAYGDSGMHKEAIESYKQAIMINPDHAEAHYGLGKAYSDLYMDLEAIDALKQAITINPDHANAHFALGPVYSMLGMHKEAIAACKQAIRIDPDSAKFHYGLGNTFLFAGMYKEAIESFKKAIRIEPDFVEVHWSLGVAYVFSNDRGSALEQHKILKTLDPELANDLFKLIYK